MRKFLASVAMIGLLMGQAHSQDRHVTKSDSLMCGKLSDLQNLEIAVGFAQEGYKKDVMRMMIENSNCATLDVSIPVVIVQRAAPNYVRVRAPNKTMSGFVTVWTFESFLEP